MNSRTDEQLQMVINNGGRVENIFLSRLMPAWNTTFNTYQQQDPIAPKVAAAPADRGLRELGDYVKYSFCPSPRRAGEGEGGFRDGKRRAVHRVLRRGRRRRARAPRGQAALAPDVGAVSTWRCVADLEAGVRVSVGMAISPRNGCTRSRCSSASSCWRTGREENAVDLYVRAFEGAGEDIASKNPPPF